MPIYEYRCPRCGHEFWKVRRMGDTGRVGCPMPKCSIRSNRLMSVPQINVKGGTPKYH